MLPTSGVAWLVTVAFSRDVFCFGVRGHGKIRLASDGLIHPQGSTLSAIGRVTKNAVIGALKGSKAKTAQPPPRPPGRSMATNRKASKNGYLIQNISDSVNALFWWYSPMREID